MLLLVYMYDSPPRGKRLSSAGTHELEHFQQSFYDSVQKTLGCRPGPQKGKGRRIVIISMSGATMVIGRAAWLTTSCTSRA
jgi:hypothetical protein